MDWKQTAERLKFEDGLSWTELYKEMKPYFPELTDKQIEEKVRGALRQSKRYHAPSVLRTSKDHFSYTSENGQMSISFCNTEDLPSNTRQKI